MTGLDYKITADVANGWFDSGVNIFRRARAGDKEAESDLDLAALCFGIAVRMYHHLGDSRRARSTDNWYESTLKMLGREHEYREGWYLPKEAMQQT